MCARLEGTSVVVNKRGVFVGFGRGSSIPEDPRGAGRRGPREAVEEHAEGLFAPRVRQPDSQTDRRT